MYAGIQYLPEATRFTFAGVSADGGEVPLIHKEQIAPFDASYLHYTMRKFWLTRRSGISQALLSMERIYERNRRLRRHAGPPLTGLRLYQERWRCSLTSAKLLERQLLAETESTGP